MNLMENNAHWPILSKLSTWLTMEVNLISVALHSSAIILNQMLVEVRARDKALCVVVSAQVESELLILSRKFLLVLMHDIITLDHIIVLVHPVTCCDSSTDKEH